MELNRIESFGDWDKWKSTLKKAINAGEAVGMSEKNIESLGLKIGNFLASTIDPESSEHRLLKELWKVGNVAERKTLTGMIVKMVESNNVKS